MRRKPAIRPCQHRAMYDSMIHRTGCRDDHVELLLAVARVAARQRRPACAPARTLGFVVGSDWVTISRLFQNTRDITLRLFSSTLHLVPRRVWRGRRLTPGDPLHLVRVVDLRIDRRVWHVAFTEVAGLSSARRNRRPDRQLAQGIRISKRRSTDVRASADDASCASAVNRVAAADMANTAQLLLSAQRLLRPCAQ
jgi:hypothetical protein